MNYEAAEGPTPCQDRETVQLSEGTQCIHFLTGGMGWGEGRDRRVGMGDGRMGGGRMGMGMGGCENGEREDGMEGWEWG